MIDLLYCGNDGVFDGVLTSALSIFKRTETKEPFHIHIFTMDATELSPNYIPITDEHIEALKAVAQKYNKENLVSVIDVTELYKQEFSGCPNESAYCSPYTLIRLLVDLVPEMTMDKLLYLDADVLFNRDIRLLWDISLDGYEYAAANDHYGKYLIRPGYINAGVLLFGMTEARKTQLFQKSREWLRKKKLVFADQSALIRSTTRRLLLPQKYNDQKFLHPKTTIVRHFSKRLFYLPYPHTDNIKQWHVEKVHSVFHYHTFDDILDEYLEVKNQIQS